MFKFQILASTNDKPRASVIALTHFSDLAEFIADHAAEALDPDGTQGMSFHVIERQEADKFTDRPRGNPEV